MREPVLVEEKEREEETVWEKEREAVGEVVWDGERERLVLSEGVRLKGEAVCVDVRQGLSVGFGERERDSKGLAVWEVHGEGAPLRLDVGEGVEETQAVGLSVAVGEMSWSVVEGWEEEEAPRDLLMLGDWLAVREWLLVGDKVGEVGTVWEKERDAVREAVEVGVREAVGHAVRESVGVSERENVALEHAEKDTVAEVAKVLEGAGVVEGHRVGEGEMVGVLDAVRLGEEETDVVREGVRDVEWLALTEIDILGEADVLGEGVVLAVTQRLGKTVAEEVRVGEIEVVRETVGLWDALKLCVLEGLPVVQMDWLADKVPELQPEGVRETVLVTEREPECVGVMDELEEWDGEPDAEKENVPEKDCVTVALRQDVTVLEIEVVTETVKLRLAVPQAEALQLLENVQKPETHGEGDVEPVADAP